ncbi:hypothetical protein HDV04_002406 [Boothiomyces sp. JEL0838]|nr:hypothetical protein HDV04_002406 [Boothiomyces sp. JEL0838]
MLPEFSEEGLYKSFQVEDESLELIERNGSMDFVIVAEGECVDGQLECLVNFSGYKSNNSKVEGLDLVLIVDVSGSMASVKLEMVKDTICYLINHQLQDHDRLAIVTFNEHANLICNFTRITSENKQELVGLVNGSLVADGGTSIIEGIKMGLDMLDCRKIINTNSAMLLFSDGEDSKPDHKYLVFQYLEQARNSGLPIQCFGYGENHDYKYLNDIALGSSNGSYSYVESEQDISSSIVGSVGGISSVIAKDLVVNLDFGSMRVIEISCGSYPVHIDSHSAKLHLKNLYSREIRNIRCKLEFGGNPQTSCICHFTANTPDCTPIQFKVDILDFSTSLQKQKAEDYLRNELSKAISLAEDGNHFLSKKTLETARDVLSRTRNELGSKNPTADLEFFDLLVNDTDRLLVSLDPQLFKKGGKFLMRYTLKFLSKRIALDESILEIAARMKEKSKQHLELCEYDFGFLERTATEPSTPITQEIVGGKMNWIAEIDSDVIARQLTLYEWEIFIAINVFYG